jgi:DNA-binding transcriptional LysR family regulator
LTEPGRAYFDRCAAIATQIDEANRQVVGAQLEPAGLLRVSAPVLYGRRYLAPVVSEYLRRYPRARVELMLVDRRVDLVEEGVDLAVRIGELASSSLTARKLGEGHTYLVASPKFLARHVVPNPSSLTSVPCIGMQPRETWSVGPTKVRVEPVLVVNDLEVACDAAVAGVGVACLPGIVCRQAVERRQLRVLFGATSAIAKGVYAVYPSRQYLPAKVRAFIDALADLVEPMRPLA